MRRARKVMAACAVTLALGGCQTMLAAAYDPTIATALSTANSDIQALFVSIGTDAPVSTFGARKPAYDHIIAELDAVLIEIKARPIPNPEVLAKVNQALEAVHVGGITVDPDFSSYPSARSVADMVKVLTQMENADQQAGLHKELIPGFEQPVITYLTQAITYENFLKR
jgi:hypothetical protein